MIAHSKPLRLRLSVEWVLPVLIMVVGIIGLLDDVWLGRELSSLVNIHAVFGASLVTFVVLRFHSRMWRPPRALPTDIRAVSRHLSRMVYLLLGMLVVFRELAGSGTHDLRDYLVYALIALIVIRLMALAYWQNSAPTNPIEGVKRPKVESYGGKTPALGDAQAQHLLELPAGDDLSTRLTSRKCRNG